VRPFPKGPQRNPRPRSPSAMALLAPPNLPARSLAPRLSEPPQPDEGLEHWQSTCVKDVQNYFDQSFSERKLLTTMVCDMPSPDQATVVAYVTQLAEKACGLSSEEARNLALTSLACRGQMSGDDTTRVSPYAWQYTPPSLWRGPTDNKKLCRIARSALNGFRVGEPIQSRTDTNLQLFYVSSM
jgi:hypothetical protein